ncbi:R-spondin-3 [Ambystoma mexicanum]|uniref:R-spondin-3 n=1 Tax=Ambystoma mexicanum TaxID=8296 RepID=UPI0037E87563
MQVRLISWVFITLNCLEYISNEQPPKGRRHRRMHPYVGQNCPAGCATCSDSNGCTSCKPRLFFYLQRSGMRQIGQCLPTCPDGFYGTRSPQMNNCTKCKAECETCFTGNFCTRCKSGFYLHSGRCSHSCPEGYESNSNTLECSKIVHCTVDEWSSWSPCSKRGKTCGFKRGNETRVREILQHPTTHGNPCPTTTETRRCIVQKKSCQKGEKGKRGRERKKKKPNKEGRTETSQENKDRASRRESREEWENQEKAEQKKRRSQNKHPKSAALSTAH